MTNSHLIAISLSNNCFIFKIFKFRFKTVFYFLISFAYILKCQTRLFILLVLKLVIFAKFLIPNLIQAGIDPTQLFIV